MSRDAHAGRYGVAATVLRDWEVLTSPRHNVLGHGGHMKGYVWLPRCALIGQSYIWIAPERNVVHAGHKV